MIELVITEAVKAAVSGVVGKFVVPKLVLFAKKMDLEYDKVLIPRAEHFEEYLNRTYKRLSILNALVLKNNKRNLKDIYVPLSLIIERNTNKEEFRIEGFPTDLISKYGNILITDTAGMGKSTMAKRMFLDVIDQGLGIPLFVDLRRLSAEQTLMKELLEQISSLSSGFDPKLLSSFLELGGFVFFLDGYDEIKLAYKEIVTRDIQTFISKAGDNKFVLTSRPENALAGFCGFQQLTIKPLTKKEAYDLLRRYDSNGNTSRSLIEKLKSGKYAMIDDFLKNPLLVSLLYTAYDYKQAIPLKKHIFYRQVYDAFFDSHDLSKGDDFVHDKKSNLSIDDFNKVLRYIGYICLKRNFVEFTKDEILKIIDDAKEKCPYLRFNSSDLLDDLLQAVPLFCQDGVYYKWAHKSLQEYFAAQYIYVDAKKHQDAILTAIYNSDKFESYVNLLDLYIDIDSDGFNKNITIKYLNSYVNSYLRMFENVKGIKAESVGLRCSLIFNNDFVFLTHKGKKSPLADINSLLKACGVKTFHSISCYGRNDSAQLFCVRNICHHIGLDSILQNRYPELYINKSSTSRQFNDNVSIFNLDAPYPVNESLFSDNQEDYDKVNGYLLLSRDLCCLNYDNVCSFIKLLHYCPVKFHQSESWRSSSGF